MISIVIPLYNKSRLMLPTLDTVASQTYRDFEVVIVDDGSTDDSTALARQWADAHPDIRVNIITQPNAGVSAARNRGIREAKGEWIAFLDADDFWIPEKLELTAREIEAHPECSLISGRFEFINEKGERGDIYINGIDTAKDAVTVRDYFHVASISDPVIWTSVLTARRDLLLRVGGFPEGVVSGEDLVTWAKLACHSDLRYINRVIASYYTPTTGPTGKAPQDLKSTQDFVGTTLHRLAVDFPDKGITEYIAFWYKMRAAINLRRQDRKAALRCVAKSLRHNPLMPKSWIIGILCLMPSAVVGMIMGKSGSPQENIIYRIRKKLSTLRAIPE